MRSLVKSHLIRAGLAALCTVAFATPTVAQQAQDATPEQKAVEIRQSIFRLMEWNFTPTIGEMLKNKMKYDAAVVQKNAARLEALAPMISEAFAVDTRKATTGVKTRAREGIWNNMADFKAKNDDLVRALASLSAAAKSGDEKAFRPAAVAVGKACGACHDDYRDK
jgi:cytochrome c556